MYYSTPIGFLKAVDDVSFNLEKGETIGIAGESGCGKSSIALSIMRILPPNGKILGGEILLDEVDIVNLPEDEMRNIRWNNISMIFQSAMNALNPVKKVGDQVVEALDIHEDYQKEEKGKKSKNISRW